MISRVQLLVHLADSPHPYQRQHWILVQRHLVLRQRDLYLYHRLVLRHVQHDLVLHVHPTKNLDAICCFENTPLDGSTQTEILMASFDVG